MPIVHDAVLYSVIREEHLVHSGFFLHEYFSLFASAHPGGLRRAGAGPGGL